MRNRKQLLADFYLDLLAIPVDSSFRIHNQPLYAMLVEVLADELSSDCETIQNIFERMAREDK